MTTHSDTFTYSDGVLETVASSYWDDWPFHATNGRKVSVSSNAIYLSTGVAAYIGAMAEYLYTYASENVFSKLQVTTLASEEAAYVIINCQDKGASTYDGYFAELWNNGGTPTYSIYKVTNSSWNQLGSSDTSEGFSDGDYIETRHNASDSIDMYHGATKLSGVGGTDSTYSAARIGIGLYADTTAAGTSRGDNWSGGDISAGELTGTPTGSMGDMAGAASRNFVGWRTQTGAI